MYPVIKSIVPSNVDLETPPAGIVEDIKRLFTSIMDSDNGLYTGVSTTETLKLINIETVMINFSYSIEEYLNQHFKRSTKEEFLKKIIHQMKTDKSSDFDIYVYYDSLTSSMGWSGSVPIKLIHKDTKIEQWITIQMRRGTIINSGRSFDIMQSAVNYMYSVLNKII